MVNVKTGDRTSDHHDRDKICLDVVTSMSNDKLWASFQDFTFCVLIMTEKTGDRTTDHHDRDKLCLDVVTVMADDRLIEHHPETSLSVS